MKNLNSPYIRFCLPLIPFLVFYGVTCFWQVLDISTQPLNPPNNKIVNGNVWLISYADGHPINLSNQNALAVSAINKGVDVIKSYRKHHIDKKFYQTNKHILEQPRGVGYWLWKPYFILKTLKEIPENDIVIYLDAGVLIIEDITPLVNLTENHDIILFENSYKNRGFIKRDTMILMGMDKQQYLEEKQLVGSRMIFKNTKEARIFVSNWLKYCKDEHTLTDIPSKNKEFYDFIDHRHDQAILTLLHLKNPEGQYIYRNNQEINQTILLHHRRRHFEPYISLLLLKILRQANLV